MNVFTDGRYDAWATGGRYSKDTDATAYCHNPACAEYAEPQNVLYEEEYGAGWYTPEECPTCFGLFHEDPPTEAEVQATIERGGKTLWRLLTRSPWNRMRRASRS